MAVELENESMLFIIDPDSDVLVISFAGSIFEDRVVPHAFIGSLKKYKASKLFIRDIDLAWYQRGMRGVSDDLEVCMEFVKDTIGKFNFKKCVVIGSSLGGYAAILFGHYLCVDVVHSFVPQIYIDPVKSLEIKDVLRKYYVSNIYSYLDGKSYGNKYLDLKDILSESNGNTEYHIHYCKIHHRDKAHAKYVEECDGVVLHEYKEGGHMLAMKLRESGELDKILSSAITI